MRTAYVRSVWWLAAGCGAGALADALAVHGAAGLARGFTVAAGGSLPALAATALLLLAPRLRRGGERSLGPFLAGAALAAAPLAIDIGLAPIPAAGAGGAAALAALFLVRGPLPGRRAGAVLPPLWLALAAGGLLQGALDRPAPPLRSFPDRSDPAPAGPDVVLISVDTLRADAVTGPRPPGLELPSFDRLRREGASAPFGLAPSGLTVPSHLTLLTGLDCLEHGVRGNFDRVPAERLDFLAERFRAAGWRTAAVISNGLLARDIGFGDGFEVFDDSEVPRLGPIRRFLRRIEGRSWLSLLLADHSRLERVVALALFPHHRRAGGGAPERGRGARTTELALGLLDELAADPRPFFLFLHYMDPHDPYGTVAPFDGLLSRGLGPPPADFTADPRHGYDGHLAIRLEEDLRSGDPARIAAARPLVERLRLAYLEEVAFVDRQLGRVLDRLDSTGRPFVLLLVGDHGEQFGEHGLMKHGNSLFEELVRVPFLLRGPGVPAGAVWERPPALEDAVPTLLALAGLEQPAGLSGRVLAVGGRLQSPPPRLHLAADDERFSLRREGWKWLAFWSDGALPPVRPWRLHDLAADPAEADPLPPTTAPWPDLAARELVRDRHAGLERAGEEQRFVAGELGYTDGGEED